MLTDRRATVPPLEKKCKTNTLPILMHHADAHFDYSSLFGDAQVEKAGNPLKNKKTDMKTVKEPSDENQTECHEIEPNPLKDRAMPEGNNPSF
jgi:hypothetical protein